MSLAVSASLGIIMATALLLYIIMWSALKSASKP